MPITSYGTWTQHGDALAFTVEDTIRNVLCDFGPLFDIDGIAADFQAALRAALPDGVTFDGREFHGPVTGERPDLRRIIRTVDMFAIAARHEKTPAPATA